jgi:hypothetical protein
MNTLLVLHHFPSSLKQLFEFDVRKSSISSVWFACGCHFGPSTGALPLQGAYWEQSATLGRSTLHSRQWTLPVRAKRMKIKDDRVLDRHRAVDSEESVSNQIHDFGRVRLRKVSECNTGQEQHTSCPVRHVEFAKAGFLAEPISLYACIVMPPACVNAPPLRQVPRPCCRGHTQYETYP